jgi:protein-L-isoaspartate(D-aspartate) O-methyltransferase
MHATAVESILPFILPSEANPAPRVLDVGSGSGYLTHVLAELVGERGKVVGVEHVPQLVEMAERNMGKSEEGRRLLESGRVRFVVGDGRMGWVEEEEERGESEGDGGKEGTGWNAIHVGASAVTVHDELVRQLRRPGRMFIPVDDEGGSGEQFIWTVDKKEDGQMERRKLFGVRYVPLTDAPK